MSDVQETRFEVIQTSVCLEGACYQHGKDLPPSVSKKNTAILVAIGVARPYTRALKRDHSHRNGVHAPAESDHSSAPK